MQKSGCKKGPPTPVTVNGNSPCGSQQDKARVTWTKHVQGVVGHAHGSGIDDERQGK